MNKVSLASIHPKAKIGNNVKIDPFAVIEQEVEIGDNCWIGSHVVIMNGTCIGEGCRIFPGAVLGAIPQDLKFEQEQTLLKIGDNVTIREYCTLNRGTSATGNTVIKDNCLLMAYVHIAHDCVIEANCVIANSVNLAGHIHIGEFARIGGNVALHQFVKLGTHCFVGGGSLVRKSVPPFIKVAREPLSYAGVNTIGLKRSEFSKAQIQNIQDIYRILFVKRGFNIRKALAYIESQIPPTSERDIVLKFVKEADRGIIKRFKNLNGSLKTKSV